MFRRQEALVRKVRQQPEHLFYKALSASGETKLRSSSQNWRPNPQTESADK